MVRRAQQQPSHMRHSKAYKRNRSAESGSRSGQHTRTKQDRNSRRLNPHAQIRCVSLTQQQRIKRLDKQQRAAKTQEDKSRKVRQLIHRDPREITHSPHHKGVHLIGRRAEIENRDHRRDHIPNHDSHDQQHRIALHLRREPDNNAKHGHRTKDSRKNKSQVTTNHQRRDKLKRPAKGEHHNCHAQISTIANTQNRGASQRIAEKRLKHKTTNGQSTSREQRREGLRQTRLLYYIDPRGAHHIGALTTQHRNYPIEGNLNSTKNQIGKKETNHTH